MPDINPSLPVVGQPDSTEEPKVVTALSQLIAAVNDVDSAQIKDGSVTLADLTAGASGLAQGSFLAYRNASLTVAASTRIIFDTDTGVGFDTSSWYDATTGKFTPQVAGIYELTWQVGFPLVTDGNFIIPQLWKNDAVYAYGNSTGQSGSTAAMVLGGTAPVQANGTTDFFDVRHQSSGNPSLALVVGSAPIRTYFAGRLVGKT